VIDPVCADVQQGFTYIFRRTFFTSMSDKDELRVARASAAGAVILAGIMGMNTAKLGFVAQVVAFAFGLAAASLFPVIVLGIFWKRMNREGAIASMLTGLVSTFSYIYYFKFVDTDPVNWWFGVSPEGIGFLFMFVSLTVGVVVALFTPAPPQEVQDLVEDIRVPGTRRPHGAGDAAQMPS